MSGALRGRLIALEGIDGCGKSTQAGLLANALGALLTFEPGDTLLGRRLRELLLGQEVLGPQGAPVPRAEALLMAADRAQHVEELVEPTLATGRWVVTDRFSASTLAYQGAGRGLASDDLAVVVRWAAGGVEPDLSVLIDLPVPVARDRLVAAEPDRLEDLDAEFHQRVRGGYLSQVEGDPSGWVVVDGDREVATVAQDIGAAVRDRLGWPDRSRR